jgi:hypothetical protein
MTSSSALKVESTQFSADVIRELDSSSIPISISNSGTISVVDGSTTKSYNTNTQPYTKTLTNNGKITVTTVSTTTTSSISSTKISSTDDNSGNTTSTGNNDASTPKPGYFGKGSVSSPIGSNNTNVKGQSVAPTGVNSGQSDDKVSKIQNAANNLDTERQARLAKQKAQDKLTGIIDGNTKLSNSAEKPLGNLVTSNSHKVSVTKNKESLSHDFNQKIPTKNHISKNLISRDTNHKLPLNNEKNTGDNPQNNEFHKTSLTLRSRAGQSNDRIVLAGTLWDKTTSRPIEGMKIYFTTTDPSIKVNNKVTVTDAAGAYETILNLPETTITYKIQAHFAKAYPYLSTESPIVTVNVRSNVPHLNDAQVNR